MEITKWEYKEVDTIEAANFRGSQGWEAFGVNSRIGKILLKRPCGRLQVIEKVNGVPINNDKN